MITKQAHSKCFINANLSALYSSSQMLAYEPTASRFSGELYEYPGV